MEAGQKSYSNPSGYTSSVTENSSTTNNLVNQSLNRKKSLEETTNILRHHSNGSEISKNPSIRRILAPQRKLRTQISKMATTKTIELQDLLPYHQYRARQRRENNVDGESVWDEETEKAFMDGLREVPRLGRRKLSVNGKPCGRNELIAEYIFKATGKLRSRKQVSSHIQVLKNLLRNNKEFMDLVSGTDKVQAWDDDFSTITNPKPNTNRYSTSTLGSHGSDSPNYHTVNDPFDSASFLYYRTSENGPSLVKPSKFSMWVGSTDASGSITGSPAHEYTCLYPEDIDHLPPSPPPLKAWKTRFPYASELHQSSLIDCPVIHFEAVVVTMDTLPSQSSIFCTQFEVTASDSAYDSTCQYECVTRIYASGAEVFQLATSVPSTTDDDGSTKLMLPFASDFWASFYTHILTSHEARASNAVSEERQQRRKERHTREAISGITVVQEVLATTILDTKSRVCLFLWEFSKAEEGQEGRVTWGDVVIPEPSFSSLHPVPRLRVDSLPELQSHFKATSPNIGEWEPTYSTYDTFSLDDDTNSSSSQLYLQQHSDLQDSPTASQSGNFSLSSQSADIDGMNLEYLQAYNPYANMPYVSASDSQVLMSQWPQFPVFAAPPDQQANCLENLI